MGGWMGIGPDGPMAGSLEEVAAAQAAAFEIQEKAEKARKEREQQRRGGSDRMDGGRLNSL